MFSIKRTMMYAAAAMAIALPATTMAQSTIASSGGPSARNYPAGKVIPANGRITLSAGDSLTIVDRAGTVRTLRGPGVFSASGSSTSTLNMQKCAALTSTKPRQARFGSVRGPGGPDDVISPNLWYVDVRSSGSVCLADPAKVQLWRTDSAAAQTLSIRTAKGNVSGGTQWKAKSETAAWPATLPISDGTAYTLSISGSKPVTITTRLLSADETADPASLAAALMAKGCTGQSRVLVEGLKI